MELTQELKNEYLSRWKDCSIKPEYQSDLDEAISTIEKNKSLYKAVSDETGVPWYVIAIIHGMEASYNFKTHLHNGDSLNARTVNVPAGRPRNENPPFTWEQSAIDALSYDGATGILSWDLPTIFWFLEGFNGWGHRTGAGRQTDPPSRSPYIYSGTIHYNKGKYVGDGSFDPDFVSKQVGCMAQLFGLVQKGLVTDLLPASPPKIENSPDEVGSVAAWQNILNGCGYYPILLITGEMDEDTIEMTKKFQKDMGLDETGVVTEETWQAGLEHKKLPGWSEVTPPLSPKKNSPPKTDGLNLDAVGTVATWQHILNGCGYQPLLALTDYMDGVTTDMTKKFQEDLGLAVTGQVTLDTWQAGIKHKKLLGWSPSLPSLITQRLYSFYTKRENYEAVYDNVMGWYGTTTNACVAFVSTALRLSGYNVPKTLDSDGNNISLWTVAFSSYLQKQGWRKFTDRDSLQSGDIVLTEDGDFGKDVPAHTYVFAGWDDQEAKVAWVIDNQGFTHRRNISKGGGGFNFTPFKYFLRA